MNLVSEIDAYKAEPEDDPDILLGEDWEERTASGDEAEKGVEPERSWLSLNRSSLTRKIITFNLLALLVLVAGVMYFNPFRDGLVQTTEKALLNETRMIARVFEAEMPEIGPVNLATGDGLDVEATLRHVGLRSGLQAMVFDGNETLIATEIGQPWNRADQPPGTLITDFLNATWEAIAGWFGTDGPADEAISPEQKARSMLELALAGQTGAETWRNANGELQFTVISPIRQGDVVVGAVAVTTLAGEIDALVREEREKLLQMFLVAVLVSITLSMVLSGTIANPLADLAAAAETGGMNKGHRKGDTRVRIPDMTGRPDEIGRLSGALRGMVAALYERIEANEQFAADVAHEIKNPLASLRSAVGTLRIAKTDEQRARLLDVIDHDVRRLDRLVSDISNASRLDSELVKEQMQPFNLIMMLNNLCVYHRQEAAAKGIDFLSDLPADPVIVNGLEARLAQVFVNIITNALSFCTEGDAVRVWARRRGDVVMVMVDDTGPGIPEEALPKIFSRFYSERPADDFGNHSGLGLAISRQIVEAHGGTIWAENIRPTEHDPMSEPVGARFVVSLPL